MKRIIWMVLMNLWYIPYGAVRLLKMAAHPENYTMQQRYDQIRQIDHRAIAAGRVKIVEEGIENLPSEDGFLLYPNHQGMFDVLAIMQVMERPFSLILKKELENIPFLKQTIACLGALPLDRSDPRQGMKVIMKTAEEVSQGKNYLIFAEGTRSKDGNKLLDFKGGSFKAATKAKCPIVPVALVDSFVPFDTGSLEKTTVRVCFLKPISYEEYKELKTTEIAQKVKRRIEEKIEQLTQSDQAAV